MKSFFSSVYFVWAVLALPSVPMLIGLMGGVEPESLLHPTGEFAARFMILSMMVTPLALIFMNSTVVKWLRLQRRAIGVAAFCYALLHTVLYLVDIASLEAILNDFWEFGIFTGWLAFFIFIPLAVTSNNTMARRLRYRWKPLQRTIYLAGVLTLLHWLYIQNEIGPALVHFLPLAGLQAYRIYVYLWGKEPAPCN